jgi:hypothetical protein
MSIGEYRRRFPSAPLFTKLRQCQYRSFRHPNKGKTYEMIYGKHGALQKKEKIRRKQTGRSAPRLAGTGITGTRRDTNSFARSTYESNLDRIFLFEKKRCVNELSDSIPRFKLRRADGSFITYKPDRVDTDGLFAKGSFLEVKGYMYPEDWEKILLFRHQYSKEQLIVISEDLCYADVDYKELEKKYKPLIQLWETDVQNYRTRPDLYKVGYITPEYERFLLATYPDHIHCQVKDEHEHFIAKQCLAYNRARLGKDPYIQRLDLTAITDKRPRTSRHSSGQYHYELWRVTTLDAKIFYVANISKTVDFYCYSIDQYPKLMEFFNNNSKKDLKPGKKTMEKDSWRCPDCMRILSAEVKHCSNSTCRKRRLRIVASARLRQNKMHAISMS